jgi:hypothetical protein
VSRWRSLPLPRSQSEFGQEFNFVADQECSNDSDHSFNVTGKRFNAETKEYEPGIGDYDRKEVEAFRETGNYYFLASTLLEYLCVEGKVEPGEYLIEVCW